MFSQACWNTIPGPLTSSAAWQKFISYSYKMSDVYYRVSQLFCMGSWSYFIGQPVKMGLRRRLSPARNLRVFRVFQNSEKSVPKKTTMRRVCEIFPGIFERPKISRTFQKEEHVPGFNHRFYEQCGLSSVLSSGLQLFEIRIQCYYWA